MEYRNSRTCIRAHSNIPTVLLFTVKISSSSLTQTTADYTTHNTKFTANQVRLDSFKIPSTYNNKLLLK